MAKPKKKILVHHINYFLDYFQRAISLGKITADDKMLESLKMLSTESSQADVQYWIDQYLTDDQWKRFIMAYQQRQHAQRHDKAIIKVGKDLHEKLMKCCDISNKSLAKLLEDYVDSDLRSHAYREEQLKKEAAKAEKEKQIVPCNDRKIGKIFKESFSGTYDFYDARNDIETFHEDLLKESMLTTEFNFDQIVQSKAVTTTFKASIFYADEIGHYVASCFGTVLVSLTRRFPKRESMLIFAGMKYNVEASHRALKEMLRTLRLQRSNYADTLSKRIRPKTRQDRLSEFTYELKSGLYNPRNKIALSREDYKRAKQYVLDFWEVK
ncbi:MULTISPECIES: hypothetical protein [Cysteiniphilum]|uniref:hypothetical protein n=1 Tax=Cysteiniphilum TaxID=2056696 RepID=UPI001783E965|nr:MULTISPECIES: hypothetical protein [Cysteiniphilum]